MEVSHFQCHLAQPTFPLGSFSFSHKRGLLRSVVRIDFVLGSVHLGEDIDENSIDGVVSLSTKLISSWFFPTTKR